jgi:hypothetical protein
MAMGNNKAAGRTPPVILPLLAIWTLKSAATSRYNVGG